MMNTSFKVILFLAISVSLSLVFTQASGASNLVTVIPSSSDTTTTLQFTNSVEDISDISSVILQIDQGVNFKSFKTESGWSGMKSSANTLTFTSTNPIKPGQSANFVIKTDQPNPAVTWKALDNKNSELGTGKIGKTGTLTTSPVTPPSQNSPPTNRPGISDVSNFRVIPSTPKAGSDIRVVGLSFAKTASLDLYIGDNKIDSFSTNENGNFILTTKIPDDQSAGSTSFFVKDKNGNSKTFNTIIQEAKPRVLTNSTCKLTINADSIYHRGETKTISGTACPGSTLTITVLDSEDNSLTTFTTIADKTGHYSYSSIVPIDAPFGEYTIVISDGKNKITKPHNIVTSHQITISVSQERIDPGQSIIINGTSISNQPVEFTIVDPTGTQIFDKNVNVTSDGKVVVFYSSDVAAVKGTYDVTASQGTDTVTAYFGVGETPVPQLTLSMDKLNYKNSDRPAINISGPTSSTLNLVIVDPSGKQKFSDIIKVASDGFVTYSFNVTSYTPGIYSAVITRGNDKATTNFAIGLQTGSGQITMKTVKDSYLLGDNIIILGKSNPNTIIKITLTDPNGIIVKSQDRFTDKAGIFSSTGFRILQNDVAGTWKLEATSGINHASLDLPVKAGLEVISVNLDKTPPVYAMGDIVTISGSGAGNSVDVIINILGSNSTMIVNFDIHSTNRGDFSTLWDIPVTFSPGTYTVQAKSQVGQATTKITIQ